MGNVRLPPVSCLMAMLGGISTLTPLIMDSKCELCKANTETMKSNLEFGNSWLVFTLYVVWRALQDIVYQYDEAACFALLITADTGVTVLRRSDACPFISPCLSDG